MARPRKVKVVDGGAGRQIRRVAGYIRVSTAMQADDGFSLADQRRRIEAAAHAGGYELARVYEDAGRSGKDLDRPALAALLEACGRGEVDGVIVAKLDRLTRSLADLLALPGRLDRAGVALISLKESIDTGTSTGRLFRNILGALAEFERDTILDRITTGMAEKAQQGRRVGAWLPYGYRLAPDGTTAVVDPQAAVVRRIFAERLAGRTIAAIAEGLNAEGIPGPAGGRWVVSRVYAVTTNPYYAGRVRFGERGGRATIVAEAVDHPALVDDTTFRAVAGVAA